MTDRLIIDASCCFSCFYYRQEREREKQLAICVLRGDFVAVLSHNNIAFVFCGISVWPANLLLFSMYMCSVSVFYVCYVLCANRNDDGNNIAKLLPHCMHTHSIASNCISYSLRLLVHVYTVHVCIYTCCCVLQLNQCICICVQYISQCC